MSPLRAIAFTGGSSVPSARFRLRQYIPALESLGVQAVEATCRFGKYPPALRIGRPFWLAAALSEQLGNLIDLRASDVVFLQREIISKLFTFERYIRSPVVLDVDDAIFLYRRGYVARRLAEIAAVVVCGNSFLAENFSRWNPAVRVIPTGVDTDRYRPDPRSATPGDLVIGWIGTSSNLPELVAIEPALARVLKHLPRVRLRIISDRPPQLAGLNQAQVEYVRWREATEITNIQGMDIGIMPLRDSEWARGKCSFKMLQYMACGLPSVVSAVGMNVEVARIAPGSIAVRDTEGWAEALIGLLESAGQRQTMGRVAREVAQAHFSVAVLAPKLAAAIRDARK